MEMEVRHGLAAVRIRIGNEPPPAVSHLLVARDSRRLGEQFAEKRSVLRLCFGEIRDVAFRYENDMLRRLRVDVPKADPRGGFAHDDGRQLLVYNPAEETFFSHALAFVRAGASEAVSRILGGFG